MRAIVDAHLAQTNAKISFDEGYPAMAATPADSNLSSSGARSAWLSD